MFNVLVSGNESAWETDQLMRMNCDRFKESSGNESLAISLEKPDTLHALEGVHTLLLYEASDRNPNAQAVRLGVIRRIAVVSGEITFRFEELGRLTRASVDNGPKLRRNSLCKQWLRSTLAQEHTGAVIALNWDKRRKFADSLGIHEVPAKATVSRKRPWQCIIGHNCLHGQPLCLS